MTTDLQNAHRLLATFQAVVPQSPTVVDTIDLLSQTIRVYGISFAPGIKPDTATWTTAYQAAFTAADTAARWVFGASTISGTKPTPSPSSPTVFDNSSPTYAALVSACNAALAAAAAPTNGQPPLTRGSELVTAALAALTAAWDGGPPTYTSNQTAVSSSLASAVRQAAALAAALTLARINASPVVPSLVFAGSAHTITRDVGSWLDDGFLVAMTVTIAGTAANNGTVGPITALTDTVMTFSSGLTNEGPIAAGAVGVTNGVTVVAAG